MRAGSWNNGSTRPAPHPGATAEKGMEAWSRYSRRRPVQIACAGDSDQAVTATMIRVAMGATFAGRCVGTARRTAAAATATDRPATACATSGDRTLPPIPVRADNRADRSSNRFMRART